MMPTHHCPDSWLLDYASGALGEAESLLVAVHATLCPSCRATIEAHEAAAGALLSRATSSALSAGALDAVLQRLDEPAPATPLPVHDSLFPVALTGYLGRSNQLDWEVVVPGIRVVVLPIDAPMPVRLFELAPGLQVPRHTHTGIERTLVISGSYTDDDGTFARGDLGLRDGTRDHNQRIDDGEACLALVVADGPLVPRSPEAEAIAKMVVI